MMPTRQLDREVDRRDQHCDTTDKLPEAYEL